jgi:hypothetical protein
MLVLRRPSVPLVHDVDIIRVETTESPPQLNGGRDTEKVLTPGDLARAKEHIGRRWMSFTLVRQF